MNLAKFPIFLVKKLNFLRPQIFAMGSSHFSTAAEPSSIKRNPSGSLSCTGSGSTYSSLIGSIGLFVWTWYKHWLENIARGGGTCLWDGNSTNGGVCFQCIT